MCLGYFLCRMMMSWEVYRDKLLKDQQYPKNFADQVTLVEVLTPGQHCGEMERQTVQDYHGHLIPVDVCAYFHFYFDGWYLWLYHPTKDHQKQKM